jgi:uncharacterized protein (UPF0332 family)
MSFDWRDFLEIADVLAKFELTGRREGLLRSAVSRAYYAAFGTARAQAASLRAATRQSAAEHGELVAFYSKRFGGAGEQVAFSLSRLRTFRNAADYDPTLEDAEALCELTLREAHGLIDLLASL